MTDREKKYLKWQREQNKENLTWRQFYERMYGPCLWMEAPQYKGEDNWLNKIMGEV